MGTHSYLIALGGNHATSRGVIANWGQSPISGRTRNERSHLIVLIGDCPQLAVRAQSIIHTTAPLGSGKRSYANAVALIETDLDPPALLTHLNSGERAHGRRPGRRWGDRPLDLDIIGWSGGIWGSRDLSIPHPAFRTRRFVLAPLVEIAADWRDPVTRLTVRQLLARLDRKRPRA